MSNLKILIVEDDTRLVEMLTKHFNEQNWDVLSANSGHDAINLTSREQFDLIVLDRDLPELEGLEVCRRIRKVNSEVMILMLTAFSEELDLVVGLESGADDYVSKPFKLAELMARIKSLLRRKLETEKYQSVSERRFHNLRINIEEHKVYIKDREIELTIKEFDLLTFLSSQPGRVFTRTQILNEVWDSNTLSYEQSINTIVKRLRKKIEIDPTSPKFIETIRGVGYRFSYENV